MGVSACMCTSVRVPKHTQTSTAHQNTHMCAHAHAHSVTHAQKHAHALPTHTHARAHIMDSRVPASAPAATARLRPHCRRLIFLSSHFAAHLEKLEERNADYARVMRCLRFDNTSTAPPTSPKVSIAARIESQRGVALVKSSKASCPWLHLWRCRRCSVPWRAAPQGARPTALAAGGGSHLPSCARVSGVQQAGRYLLSLSCLRAQWAYACCAPHRVHCEALVAPAAVGRCADCRPNGAIVACCVSAGGGRPSSASLVASLADCLCNLHCS